jgi:hypothetical protein
MRIIRKSYRQSAILQVRKSGRIGKSQYVVFDDGTVVIETPKGVRRFNDPQELVSQAKSLVSRAKALSSASTRPYLRLV